MKTYIQEMTDQLEYTQELEPCEFQTQEQIDNEIKLIQELIDSLILNNN